MWVSLVRRNLQEGMGDYSTMPVPQPVPQPVLWPHMKMEQTAARMAVYLEQSTHKKKPGDGSKLLRRYNLWPRPVKSPTESLVGFPLLCCFLCVLWKSIKSSCLRRSAKALAVVPLWVSGWGNRFCMPIAQAYHRRRTTAGGGGGSGGDGSTHTIRYEAKWSEAIRLLVIILSL